MVLSLAAVTAVVAGVAGTAHCGGLAVWAVLVNGRRLLSDVPTEMVIRVYRGWGAAQGLSLGLWILAMLVRYPGQANPGRPFPESYALAWGGLVDRLTLIRAVCFGLLWVSYLILEVWTLEPCRRLDQGGQITDPARYEAAAGRVGRHLLVNALLAAAVVGLGALGARG